MNYLELGAKEKEKGNIQKALECFDIAINTERNLGAYLLRSQIYQDLGRYKEAINDLNVIIQNKPKFPTAYFGRGMAYYLLGEEENNDSFIIKSAEDMNTAVKLNPAMKEKVLAFKKALENRK
jgi:tetratricopeptide (TPR) repeat protein